MCNLENGLGVWMFKDGTLSFDHMELNRLALAVQQAAVTKLGAKVTEA